MIGIFAFRLVRGEHPQGHPIGLNGADEWTRDSVRCRIKNAERKQKQGNQQWFFHIFNDFQLKSFRMVPHDKNDKERESNK
jgi:hypothetical protein